MEETWGRRGEAQVKDWEGSGKTRGRDEQVQGGQAPGGDSVITALRGCTKTKSEACRWSGEGLRGHDRDRRRCEDVWFGW